MRRALLPALALLLALGAAGCSGDDEPQESPTSQATPTAPERARPAERPREGACYVLTPEQAVAPTTAVAPVPCTQRHTARTFHVGALADVVDGHLLAVDSRRVRDHVARECPRRFASYVGGSAEARRLSVLTRVWFSPSVEESAEGQRWFRCDIIALDSPGKLAPLSGRLATVLDTPAGRARWGLCATAKPGTRGAHHVPCSRDDAWRAVASLDVRPGPKGAWPGEKAARDAGADCVDKVRMLSDDKLNFSWGYEWPTRAQWNAGQHYGFCWAPKGT